MGDSLLNTEVCKKRAGNGTEEACRLMWEAARKEGEVMDNLGKDGGAEEAERESENHDRYPALPVKQTGPKMPPGRCLRRGLCRPQPCWV